MKKDKFSRLPIKDQINKITTDYMIIMLLIVFIAVLIGSTVNKFSTLSKNVVELGQTVADELNGDMLYDYATTGETDEEFNNDYIKLQRIKENFSDCVFMYVFCPTDSSAIYIYDVYTDEELQETEEGFEPYTLGYNETWDNLGTAYELYKTGSRDKVLDVNVFSAYGSLVSYYAPVYGIDGQIKAIIGIDYSFTEFIEFLIRLNGIVLLLLIIVGILLARMERIVVDKTIVAPIMNLKDATHAYATSEHDGNSDRFLLQERENSNNELDALSSSFNKMMQDTDAYIKNIEYITAERERIGAELNVATNIQASYLPRIFPPFPEDPQIDLYATMDPAKEVGGDFYDFFKIDDNHIGLVMADVSGKGVPAALFMMIGKTLIKNQAQLGQSPSEVFRVVNNQLCEGNDAQLFITAWLGILDLNTGVVTAANAGHEFPAIMRRGGDFELYKDKHDIVLAAMEGLRYHQYEFQLNPGDKLVVYTDGVAEATDADNNLFGTDRMLEALNGAKDESPENILRALRAAIDAFVGDAPQFDDITMLGLSYRGNKE